MHYNYCHQFDGKFIYFDLIIFPALLMLKYFRNIWLLFVNVFILSEQIWQILIGYIDF